MKKIIVAPALCASFLFLVAFSPADINATYLDISKDNLNREFNEEVSSFTEMYTRCTLSDKSTWSHRYKTYELTSQEEAYSTYSLALNRN